MVCLKLKAYESLTNLLLLLPIFSEIQTEKNICQLKPNLPLVSIAQKIRGTILKKELAFTTLYGSKTLSNCPQSTAPNPLFSAPPAWNEKDVKKNVKKDGAAIGQTDHLGQTPRRSKHPSFHLFLPLVPLEEPLTSKL